MKTINNNVFLSKILQKIKDGEFDEHLNLPFMTKELLYISIKNKIQRKIETGGTPILNDSEIKECIGDVKETAANIVALYLKLGFMERTDTGFNFTDKGHTAVRAAYRG